MNKKELGKLLEQGKVPEINFYGEGPNEQVKFLQDYYDLTKKLIAPSTKKKAEPKPKKEEIETMSFEELLKNKEDVKAFDMFCVISKKKGKEDICKQYLYVEQFRCSRMSGAPEKMISDENVITQFLSAKIAYFMKSKKETAILQSNLEALVAYPELMQIVIGRCKSIGSEKSNEVISLIEKYSKKRNQSK